MLKILIFILLWINKIWKIKKVLFFVHYYMWNNIIGTLLDYDISYINNVDEYNNINRTFEHMIISLI